MTGLCDASAASLAEPSPGWRMTSTSAYCSTILTVSTKDSPFFTEVVAAVANPKTWPPKCSIADEKLNFVLVLGSKNNEAMMFPFRSVGCSFFSNFFATSSTCNSSALEKSRMEMISLPLKFMRHPFGFSQFFLVFKAFYFIVLMQRLNSYFLMHQSTDCLKRCPRSCFSGYIGYAAFYALSPYLSYISFGMGASMDYDDQLQLLFPHHVKKQRILPDFRDVP